MRELDARAIEQLQALYEAAAEDVRRDIAAAAGGADLVPDHALRRLLAGIEETISRLGQQRDALLTQNIAEAAQLGVRPFTLQGVAAVGGAQAVLTTGSAATVAADAVQFVMGARQADGLILSDRLWRLDQGAKEVLQRAIGSAVVRGISAARAAQQLITQGQRVPDALSQAIDGARLGRLAKLADILVSGDGGEVWKAERVFRTELNRAHGEAYMAGAIQAPGFAGFRFLLSPRHPRPDICDLLAAQNIHGLGPGVYPTRELTPWPAHPNTLSFLVAVFEDEVSEADRAGKETPLQALQRLGPEIRAGVLGATKAEYFDQGLLTRGMLRARLRSVEERLQRQGKLS